MNWTVDVLADAEDELADIWINASNRSAITVAQDVMERRLVRNPRGEGLELSEGLWKITEIPLVAYYEVDEDQQRVIVTHFEIR